MKTYSIDCGSYQLPLKVFDTGTPIRKGQTVVITAGMDGDEFTGMETAKRLIRTFSHRKPVCGRLIILPLVNVSGFSAKTNINPHDGKHLKLIYPGNRNGTESERIIAWITLHYLDDADIWIDLHSGDSHESLTPFVWGHKTGNKEINERTQRLLQETGAGKIVYQKNFRWRKVEQLANIGCAYFIFESGEKGIIKSVDVKQQESWVMNILIRFGMIQTPSCKIKENQQYFTEVHEYTAPTSGCIWDPCVYAGQTVEKGQMLGMYLKSGSKKRQIISSRQQGIILWYRMLGSAFALDILVAIGW